MTGARSYTTRIWRLPSSIGFSSADALFTSMDPPGEPVISTRKRPCQKIQNGSEFPELVAQNSRNPQLLARTASGTRHVVGKLQTLRFLRFDLPTRTGTKKVVNVALWTCCGQSATVATLSSEAHRSLSFFRIPTPGLSARVAEVWEESRHRAGANSNSRKNYDSHFGVCGLTVAIPRTIS